MLALSLRLCMVNRQGKAVYLYNCVYISKVYFIFGQSQDFIILIVLGGKIICIDLAGMLRLAIFVDHLTKLSLFHWLIMMA